MAYVKLRENLYVNSRAIVDMEQDGLGTVISLLDGERRTIDKPLQEVVRLVREAETTDSPL